MLRRFWMVGLLFAGVLLAAPEVAFGVSTQPTLALNSAQVWTAVIGFLTPAVGYVINKYAPWVSEPIKAAVQIALAAAAGAIYSAIAVHSFGWNTGSLELVATAVVAALFAHKAAWLPSGVAQLLGSGQNARPARAQAARRK